MIKTVCLSMLAVSVLMSCQQVLEQSEGTFSIQIKWPEREFKTQVIPIETKLIQVRVSGQGLEKALLKELPNDGSLAKMNLKLPQGRKSINARALDDKGVILAEDSEDVLIESGKTTRAELDLQPLKEKVVLPDKITSNTSSSGVPQSRQLSPPSGQKLSPPGKVINAEPGNTKQNPQNKPPTLSGDKPPHSEANQYGLLPLSTGPGLPPGNNGPNRAPIQGSSSGGSSSGGGSSPPPATGGGSSGGAPPPPAPNAAPVITSVTADPNPLLGVSHPTEVTVVATDSDDTLTNASYTWSCDGGCGSFNQTDGTTVIWTSPATAGSYTLRVSVNDGTNSAVEQTTSVTVQDGNATINFNGGGH